jgi:folylpolyglutamate synthase/dihydropteroate synthase
MQDKDLVSIVRPLEKVVSRLIATQVPSPRAWTAEALGKRLAELLPECRIEIESEPERAVDLAFAGSRRAVAAGSIFLVGPLRARLLAAGAVSI